MTTKRRLSAFQFKGTIFFCVKKMREVYKKSLYFCMVITNKNMTND